jgi:hypothetical protein
MLFLITFVILSLLQANVAKLDNTRTKLCGTLSISHKLARRELVWRRRSKVDTADRYDSSCRFIAARYNCDRFDTSAPDYELVLDESKRESHCMLPDMDDLLLLLTNHRPSNILMIGDSHV